MSYNVEIGEWVFETMHWSRYAMSDDDDDDEDDGESKAASAKMMPPPPPLGPAGRVPRPRGSATAGSKGAGSDRVWGTTLYFRKRKIFLVCVFFFVVLFLHVSCCWWR